MIWLPYSEAYPDRNSTVSGTVLVARGVTGHGLAPRDVLAYLPPAHDEHRSPLPVLFLHDGQNVFDAATSSFGEEWGADEAAEALARDGLPAIVVAVNHGGDARLDEYGPWRTRHPKLGDIGGLGDAHVTFLERTVRPAVLARFNARRDAAGTGVGGSSMGALVSVYAAVSRPDAFGFCAALSPSVWFHDRRVLEWTTDRDASGLRAYVDAGRLEGDEVVRDARALADALAARGADAVFVEDPSGEHKESAWRRRFPAALAWFVDAARRPGARAA